MGIRRPGCALAGLIALASFTAGCSTSSEATASQPQWSVAALGDSVPRGTNCDCTPYTPRIPAVEQNLAQIVARVH